MPQVIIDYHPSRPQRLFHNTTADEVMYGGEIGGGKTAALVMDALLTALKYPKVTMYIFRATYQQGGDTLLEEIERRYPKEIGKYVEKDTTFFYCNGSKLKIRQCKTLDDAMKNDGKEFSKLYIDEAQHLTFDAFDYLCTRPRANKALGVQPQVKFTAMQGGKGHTWINRTFVKPMLSDEPKLYVVKNEKTGVEERMYRQFIRASLSDNMHVDSKYSGRLGMRSEKLQRKVRYNDWNALEGQAFKEWRDAPLDENGNPTDKFTHVIKPFPIPENWPIFRGYDYGRSKPYSFVWLTKGDERYKGRLFMICECYGGTDEDEGLDEPAAVQAEKAMKIELPLLQRHGDIEGVADPSIFSKTAYENQSIADMMGPQEVYDERGNFLGFKPGLTFCDPRWDPRVANNVINNRLIGKELIHNALIFDAEGYPGFQVFDTCTKFRKHFPELVTSPKNPDDVDSDNTNDHDYDAFRYVIVLTKPKVQTVKEKPIGYRPNPLGFERRQEDYGKVVQMPGIPQIVIGG